MLTDVITYADFILSCCINVDLSAIFSVTGTEFLKSISVNERALFPSTCDCECDNDARPLQAYGTDKSNHLSALNHRPHGKSDPHNQTAELKIPAHYIKISHWQIL